MKRITKGTPEAIWWVGKQGTCGLCGEVIEFEHGDTPYVWESSYPSTYNAELLCPTCGESIQVDMLVPVNE